MVESEAKELARRRHARRRHVRPPALPAGDRGDHPACREGRQGAARSSAAPINSALEKEMLGLVEGRSCAPPMRSPTRRQRHAAVDAAKAKVMAHSCRKAPRARALDPAGSRRGVQGPRSQDRALEHPRHRHPHRRPRRRRPSARSSSKSAFCRAPIARRCSPVARRRRWSSPRSAPARTSSSSTRSPAPTRRRFLLHYNFPPFSVGETGRMGSPGRREIGHGKLAWRAIRPVLPAAAGVPLHHPRRLRDHRVERLVVDGDRLRLLAGADGCRRAAEARRPPASRMGLILEGERFAVLSDILGDEDHLGDMDFKVAGTEQGVTSLQMDIKIAGITEEIMRVALGAGEGRPPAHPRRNGRRRSTSAARRARRSMRRASRCSPSRPTRSAK